MIRHLFDAVVEPTVSYGCDIWGTIELSTLHNFQAEVPALKCTLFSIDGLVQP